MFNTPEWVKDAVFYQIFPDRFARNERISKPTNLESWEAAPTPYGFKGGDLLGVRDHLDYLADLGITAIYFTPVFQSTANHRYHTHDYYQIDPILGGNAAFRELLEAAHARGIRVVLDGVFNHASRGFLQFNHLLENGANSPYVDWFISKSFPLNAYDPRKKPNYEAWWGLPALPKLNTENPQVRAFIYNVAEYWLQQGIDGWRLDVPEEIKTAGFWEEFRRRVKKINPEAYIVGEIWTEAARDWLQGDRFDAVMNYPFNRAAAGFFGGAGLNTRFRPGGFRLKRLNSPNFARQIEAVLKLYPWEVTQVQLNLLSSHDEPRFLTLVGGDPRRLRLATLFQMTFPGAPSIYYGDEVGMEGGSDPDCRRAFIWDEHRWNLELFQDFKRFIALRKAHPVLRRGNYIQLHARGQAYAFVRADANEIMVIALNMDQEPAALSLNLQGIAGAQSTWLDELTGEKLPLVQNRLHLTVPPFDGRVLSCPLI